MDQVELESRFNSHPLSTDVKIKVDTIRSAAIEFATLLNQYLPDSRDKSLALTKLEESVMHANACLARNQLLA